MSLLQWVGAILLMTGCVFGLIGAIGLLRLPTFFDRIHAAGVTDTLCAGLVLTGLMLMASDWLVVVKLMMILFFLLFTTPTASHVLARSALKAGLRPRAGNQGARR